MQKIVFILLLVYLISGCSVNRIRRNAANDQISESREISLKDDLLNQNLSNQSFFIQKAEIEVIGQDGSEKLLGTIKFKSPDNYLISIRSRTGIEAARIFITDDTILINDRINRKQFCGSPDDLKGKYGVTTSLLPLLFGDYIDFKLNEIEDIQCSNGRIARDVNIEGIKIRYIIDCERRKPIVTTGESGLNDEVLEIQYNEFFKSEKKVIPGKIVIMEARSETTIVIKIRKIEIPWTGVIEFVPGNRYEIIQLQ